MADDIQLDDAPETPSKPKSATPAWMVATVILAFGCLVAALTLQIMEYQYLRGGTPSPEDPYKAPVLIPAT